MIKVQLFYFSILLLEEAISRNKMFIMSCDLFVIYLKEVCSHVILLMCGGVRGSMKYLSPSRHFPPSPPHASPQNGWILQAIIQIGPR